ncbi:cytochrome P450 [Schizophyllum amplum]|uniref:Cytochrome P450 n=1 Tax=Schizophyllum amplum TaxID=97359 RepID=A0A550C9Y8_9AGAR|nr:cytochrome P450 [Auriculariopsis ampla]
MVSLVSLLLLGTLGLCAAIRVALHVFNRRSRTLGPDLTHIPAIGNTGVFTSWISAFQCLLHTDSFLQEGYDKYKGRCFRVPELTRWIVILSGDLIPEYLLQTEYTMGKTAVTNAYHIPLFRKITRNLDDYFPQLRHETARLLDNHLRGDAVGPEWKPVVVSDMMFDVICRATNTVYVGSKMASNDEYVHTCIGYSNEVAKITAVANLLPSFLQSLILPFFSVNHYVRKATHILRPLIEERQGGRHDLSAKFGRDEQYDDFLQWAVSKAAEQDEYERDPVTLTRRILLSNFVTLHTTTMTFLHALLHVAANQRYVSILREEVSAVIAEHGWTKEAVDKMYFMDSLFKEVQRFDGLGCLTLTRKARETFQFSDGTVVPKGAFLAVARSATQLDDANHANAGVFDPWRFATAANGRASGLREPRDDLTHADPTSLGFGLGRTACPGRFFAATLMKMMLAHMVFDYDLAFDPKKARVGEESARPINKWFSGHCIPDPAAKVYFRKRVPV